MKAVRTTLVTGSGSGMGRAVATLLLDRGERVIGVDLVGADIVGNLADASARNAIIETVASMCPDGLDAVIACAGVANPDGRRVIAINYFGVVDLLTGLHPTLSRGKKPRAVAVASSASILPTDPALVDLCLSGNERAACDRADGNSLAYASSKLALTRWIRRTSLAAGWADAGLLLNGVSPGLVNTPMIAPLLRTENGRRLLAQSAPHVTPEAATADDVAPLLAFLASADNCYMVGQVPFCDGGKDVLLRGDDVLRPAPLQT